jgi:hypothetical protein
VPPASKAPPSATNSGVPMMKKNANPRPVTN